ncbi:MAG: hypothetical protein O3A88_00985 [Proteobacteria bacterium]|nr:hypothetical protein [Pseudomonadota bacterium]
MRGALLGLAGWALAACAAPSAPNWENPERPVAQWPADIRACQSLANREAERQYVRDSRISGDRGELAGDRLSARLDAMDAERERSRLLEACLTQQGYRRAGVKR